MDSYERIIELVRRCGEKRNPIPPMIGVMGKNGKIKLDNLTLEKDDYLMDCNLRLSGDEKMCFHTSTSEESSIKEYKDNILSEGDKVLVMKLSGREMFILMAKVVEAL